MTYDQIDVIKDVIVNAVSDVLPAGVAPRPQVHIFDDTLEQPYVGYVVCRRYYRGQDAAAAISHLGLIAAMMCASQLLVVWEESDLRTSIFGGDPGDHPHGLAVLDAPFPLGSAHTLDWHPFQWCTSDGTPVYFTNPALSLEWGHASRHPGAPLPDPIPALLTSWRAAALIGPDGVEPTLTAAVSAGYEFHLTRS